QIALLGSDPPKIIGIVADAAAKHSAVARAGKELETRRQRLAREWRDPGPKGKPRRCIVIGETRAGVHDAIIVENQQVPRTGHEGCLAGAPREHRVKRVERFQLQRGEPRGAGMTLRVHDEPADIMTPDLSRGGPPQERPAVPLRLFEEPLFAKIEREVFKHEFKQPWVASAELGGRRLIIDDPDVAAGLGRTDVEEDVEIAAVAMEREPRIG